MQLRQVTLDWRSSVCGSKWLRVPMIGMVTPQRVVLASVVQCHFDHLEVGLVEWS